MNKQKFLALQALYEQINDNSDEAIALTFASEDDALRYAYRLSQLKPGDTVFMHGSESGRTKCIYVGRSVKDDRVLVLTYDQDEKSLDLCSTPLSRLGLPNEETDYDI